VIVELAAAECIVELHSASCFRGDSRWTLQAFVFTVEFVDQIQPLGMIHIDLAYIDYYYYYYLCCCGNSCPASTGPSAVIAGTRSEVTKPPF